MHYIKNKIQIEEKKTCKNKQKSNIATHRKIKKQYLDSYLLMFVYLCTNHRKFVKEEHSDICDSNVIADPDFEQNTSLESIHLSEIKYFNERSRLGVVSPVK